MIIERVPPLQWPAMPPRPGERVAAYGSLCNTDSTWHLGRRLAGEAIQHLIRTQGLEKAKRALRDPRLDEVRP